MFGPAGDEADRLVSYFERFDVGVTTRSLPDDLPIQALLSQLDDQVYTLNETDRFPLLNVSHLIEQWAWRAGSGAIHAGFQHLSRLAESEQTWRDYRSIAAEGVDTHVYGVPDWEPEDSAGVTVHRDDDETVADLWFVVFDGGDESRPAALLAREVHPDEYRGFWTFQPDLVGDIVDHVERDLQPAIDGE